MIAIECIDYTIDEEENRRVYCRCRWCGHEEIRRGNDGYEQDQRDWEEAFELRALWYDLFVIDYSGKRRQLQLPDDFPSSPCLKCSKELTPWVVKFADIALLKTYVNNLGKAINEQRKQDR